MVSRNYLFMLGIIFALMVSGCSRNKDKFAEKSPEELYAYANKKLEKKSFEPAAEAFDEVDRQHPYSQYATKAQLLKGYAYYQAQKYPKALAAFDSFIQLHPGHEDAAYAHYLRALCFYEQIFNVKRDQKTAQEALVAFDDVMRRFPQSQYSRDAKMKRDLVLDHLAGREMTVGRFYLKKGGHAAAVNRFRVVLQRYQGTSHIPEALHRLVECYMAMGLEQEATEVAAVLGHNFPDSSWYAETFYLLKGVDLRHNGAKDTSLWEKVLGFKLNN